MKLEIKTSLEIWGISEENKDTLTFFEQVKWQPVDENIEWLDNLASSIIENDHSTKLPPTVNYWIVKNIRERIKLLKGDEK
jgi:hypothetical protein